MRFDDGFADGQAHAAALRLGRKERVEDPPAAAPCRCRLQGSGSGVLPRLQFDRKDATRVVHRLDAVQHEVHQHLLDLHAVRTDGGRVASKTRTDGNSMSCRLSAQHFNRLADDLVQRERLLFRESLL
jgi:hypothetical protein